VSQFFFENVFQSDSLLWTFADLGVDVIKLICCNLQDGNSCKTLMQDWEQILELVLPKNAMNRHYDPTSIVMLF